MRPRGIAASCGTSPPWDEPRACGHALRGRRSGHEVGEWAGEVRVASFLNRARRDAPNHWSARRKRRAGQRDYSHARVAREGWICARDEPGGASSRRPRRRSRRPRSAPSPSAPSAPSAPSSPSSPSTTTGSITSSSRGGVTLATRSSGSLRTSTLASTPRSRTWIVDSRSTSGARSTSISCGRSPGRPRTLRWSSEVNRIAPSSLDRRRGAGEDERDVGQHLLRQVDGEEVDVQGAAASAGCAGRT